MNSTAKVVVAIDWQLVQDVSSQVDGWVGRWMDRQTMDFLAMVGRVDGSTDDWVTTYV